MPEIYEGVIEIKAVARDPGSRAKICVFSSESLIDPVGACVGIRGSRVQDVVRSLNGEAIDIVLWSEDPLIYVKGAIAPADMVKGVLYYDETDRINVEVIVPDNQLSKAIGRRGQNVKLASQLTGFKIDVFSESDYSQIIEVANEQLQRIEGLTEEHIEILLQHRYHTISQVYDEETIEMAEILEIDEAAAQIIIDNAATALDQLTEEEKQARLKAEQES